MYEDFMVFITLVQLGSFTAVAKKLNTSQPTISRRITVLEEELGTQLLKRNSRHVEITNMGMVIYEKLAQQYELLNQSIQEIKQIHKTNQTRLRVALPPIVSFFIIINKLPEFLAANPNISLDLFFQRAPVDLVGQNIDIAINANMPTSQSVKIRLLTRYSFCLYASKKYIESYGQPTNFEELHSHTIVGLINPDDSINSNISAYNRNTGEVTQISNNSHRILSNDLLNVYQMMLNGQAICGGWDEIFENELTSGEIIKIMPNFTFGEFPLYLIRNCSTVSPAINKFTDFMLDCFKCKIVA